MSYIYVLSNPAFPGLVKIGLTTHTVRKRADELFSTGVPDAFAIEGSWRVPESILAKTEKDVHRALRDYRYRKNREFFVLEPSEATRFVDRFLKKNRALSTEFSAIEAWCLVAIVISCFGFLVWFVG